MDFGDTRRGEVVEYVRRKYGDDHVAQIVTFGTMAARGVIRDVGRALNMSYADCDVIAKLVPAGPHVTLDDALRISRELREKYEGDEQVKKLIDTARALEGMPRHASTHAAGVVITKRPVVDYVPLARNDDTIVCQYVMTTLEELGLLKMDFLGLRNLTILDDAVKTIREKDKNFTLAGIPENDAATYEMLAAGRTSGVFQLESSGMTGVCVSLKPQNIEDITALIALYRPGPMESIPKFIACKHDPKKVTYLIPQLEPILSITYGCIVYQEQVIQIFQQLAGYSLGQADMLRRAMSKKKVKDIERERRRFCTAIPRAISPAAWQTASTRRPRRKFTRKFTPSRTTRSTRRTPRLMRSSHIRRHTSSATIRKNTWRRCSRACSTRPTRWASTSPSAASAASSSCRRTSTIPPTASRSSPRASASASSPSRISAAGSFCA